MDSPEWNHELCSNEKCNTVISQREARIHFSYNGTKSFAMISCKSLFREIDRLYSRQWATSRIHILCKCKMATFHGVHRSQGRWTAFLTWTVL